MSVDLSARRAWVFDLDNTLYDARNVLYEQIGGRMTDYVARLLGVDRAEAFVLQKKYLDDYGATLTGLMDVHGADPRPFLDFVHDVDLSEVAPDPELGALIGALPGRKFVFTNGSRAHAQRVIGRLGLEDVFNHHFSIEDADFSPKPAPAAFARLIARHAIAPADAVMFEDIARNLAPAFDLGFATVLVSEQAEPAAHIHYVTADLKDFLTGLARG